jgi:hypothetical protein
MQLASLLRSRRMDKMQSQDKFAKLGFLARKHLLAAALGLFFSFFSGLSQAQITPLGDAFTNTAAASTNYGANVLLNVNGAKEVAYIQFNLASIPASATVSKATLKLYVNAVTTAGSFNVDFVNGSWVESTITSSLSPALGTTIEASVPITTAEKNQYILIDITSAAQAWLSGSQANDGIALVANGTFNASFDSKENTTTSHPPELDIVVAGGGGSGITGITTAAGSGLIGGGTSGKLNLSLTTACATNQVLAWTGTAWACATPKGTGTVTSVGLSAPSSDFTISGSPVTKSGTLALNWNTAPTANDTDNAIVKRDSTGSFSASLINAIALNVNNNNSGLNSGLAIIANATGEPGILGGSDTNSGVAGSTVSGFGVSGIADDGDGMGVYGSNLAEDSIAIYGIDTTQSSAGLVGIAPYAVIANGSVLAGEFIGNVEVEGALSKDSGSFKIDHPLDPANKYLYHSFVESPDMMNIYNGNVTTDAAGEAVVALPEWFETLNRDFRYQLTVLGQFAQAIVSSKVANHQFSIQTDRPNVEVSWQVTGIRQDAWANAHRIPVEEMKPEKERGFYRHPELYNAAPEKSIAWARHPRVMKPLNPARTAKLGPAARSALEKAPAPATP